MSRIVQICAALGALVATLSATEPVADSQARIDSVYIKGDSSDVIVLDRIFNQRNLEQLANNILNGHYDSGYYWASVKVDKIRKDGNQIELELSVIKGPLVRLASAVYSGLTRTNHSLVARYIPINAGDTLSNATLQRAEKAAAGIGFVTFHPPPVVRPLEGYTSADLEFQFSEKRQFTFEGGGGYLPDNPNGVVWHLNLHFNNLFGGGRQASIFSERLENNRNVLRLGYGQPLFVAGVGYLSLDVSTRDYREQFYEFSLEGTYLTQLRSNLSAGLSLGWKSVEPTGSQPSYSRFTSHFSIEQEILDNRMNPANGLDLHWTIAYSYRRYREDSLTVRPERNSFNETRVSVSVKWYKQVSGRLIGHLGLNYIGLETNESLPPVSELILIGGPGTIRGFRNEQFAVLRTAFGSIEPRLRFSDGYLFTFYDAAYLNNRIIQPDETVKTDELYRYGYGFGIALHDSRRAIILSLGWNPELQFDQPWLSVEFSSDI
jgi:outer membrane protein assembly factor BamA